MNRPLLNYWREWSWEDYLVYFLSFRAARARARRAERSPAAELSETDLVTFCEPIRARLARIFCGTSPRISIQLPCRNDHAELLATLVSYTLLDIERGDAELIVVDNGSIDQSPMVLRACGVKHVSAPEPGMGKARRAAYDAMSPSVEFVWLTDCDARAVPPIRRYCHIRRRSTILKTNINCMSNNASVIAISTGIVYEYTHPLFRLLRAVAVIAGKAPRIHCWTGPNQFIRRSALDAIGGINPNVPYRAREDHQRMYELARYGKSFGAQMLSAATTPGLYDPVYHSGRGVASPAAVILRLLEAQARRKQLARLPRDPYGFPVHPNDRIT